MDDSMWKMTVKVLEESYEAELATIRAENEAAQRAIRLIMMYLDNGEPHSALRVSKEALK